MLTLLSILGLRQVILDVDLETIVLIDPCMLDFGPQAIAMGLN